jgi:hypothetical protein
MPTGTTVVTSVNCLRTIGEADNCSRAYPLHVSRHHIPKIRLPPALKQGIVPSDNLSSHACTRQFTLIHHEVPSSLYNDPYSRGDSFRQPLAIQNAEKEYHSQHHEPHDNRAPRPPHLNIPEARIFARKTKYDNITELENQRDRDAPYRSGDPPRLLHAGEHDAPNTFVEGLVDGVDGAVAIADGDAKGLEEGRAPADWRRFAVVGSTDSVDEAEDLENEDKDEEGYGQDGGNSGYEIVRGLFDCLCPGVLYCKL